MKRIIILILLFGCTAVYAQWDATSTGGYVSSGFAYQRWSNENNDIPIQQTVFPISVFWPIQDGLYFSLSNTPGMARYDETTLTGFSDTWFRLTYVFLGNLLMANVGVGIPTGKTNLDEEEFGLSRLLSENALRFRLPNYGQGISAKVGIAAAYPLQDELVVGVGVNFIYKRFYFPLEERSLWYDPGDEVNIFIGFDARLGPSVSWKGDFIYTLYGADRLNDERVYGSGDKMLVSSSFLINSSSGMIMASLRWRQKGKNELWRGSVFDTESMNRNGHQFELDGFWQFMENDDWTVRILAEGRYYLKNEYEEKGALIYGAGIGATYRFSGRWAFRSHMKVLTGSLRGLTDVNVTGLDIAGAFYYTL